MNIQHRPKIEIPNNFHWVSDSYRQKHNAWLLDMFGYEEEPETVIEYAKKTISKQTKQKRKRKMTYEHGEKQYSTLGELLDGIEGIFDSMRLPDDSLSWLSKKEMKALRNLGVHVPNPWLLDLGLKLGEVTNFPAIMSVSTSTKSSMYEARTKNRYSPTLVFAIRQPKLPIGVEMADGVPYLFGQCFTIDQKNFWVAMYVTVARTGKVTMCKQMEVKRVPIVHKRRDPVNGRTSYISEKRWSDSAMVMSDENRNSDTVKAMTEALFINMFDWWSRREERWSVGVRNSGNRVTFCVEQENTKLYFTDRDKTVKAADGKAKRIIHYVREHERDFGEDKKSTVREHIRGIREFDWNGFHCIVTSPKFHNKTASSFNLSPIDFDGGSYSKKDTIGINKLAKLLANFEDFGSIAAKGEA